MNKCIVLLAAGQGVQANQDRRQLQVGKGREAHVLGQWFPASSVARAQLSLTSDGEGSGGLSGVSGVEVCTLGPLGAPLERGWEAAFKFMQARHSLGARHPETPRKHHYQKPAQTWPADPACTPALVQPATPRQRSLCEMKGCLMGCEEVGACN